MTEGNEKLGKAFDPSRYLTRLPRRARQGDGLWRTVEADYLEVKWRLLWLRTEHPDAAIETEMASTRDDAAIFRARVSIPGGGSATGWGHETAADFGDYLEKAETKALGRALAALGYGTQFCEDFEFEQTEARAGDRSRVVDAPIQHGDARTLRRLDPDATNVTSLGNTTRRPVSARVERNVAPATQPQIKAIYSIARGTLALDEQELDARCRERYGSSPQELTRRQASEFIDALKVSLAENAS